MTNKKSELLDSLHLKHYPRSNQYDPEWVLENLMGPNVLWLTEAITNIMNLKEGMRVLDLGCGMASSSIFLAKEFNIEVWATDLWIPANENWQRIQEAGINKQVFPIHAEAHSLPFAHGFFDAIISMDAYQYFGTDDLYLSYLAPFVRDGGELGIVVPGLVEEFVAEPPEHLKPFWNADCWSFHNPQWWQKHWEKSGRVEMLHADHITEGWREWLLWLDICELYEYGTDPAFQQMLKDDQGKNLGFTRLLARKLGI